MIYSYPIQYILPKPIKMIYVYVAQTHKNTYCFCHMQYILPNPQR